ncbi:MAG: isoprenylcysteine carboxylmethyltransferase family protein [Bryobacterales bacterium]|nr:isoprenylcysteine carboxylmethyltransferase family protein [Bryobacterales bacterium]
MPWIQEAKPASRRRHLLHTLLQTAAMWTAFLAVLPAVLYRVESAAGLPSFAPQPVAGWLVFTLASALGLWTGATMAWLGDGTPWPRATARKLVIAGPYRYIRNPMAVAGLVQGFGIALVYGSPLLVVYVVLGGVLWNTIARPVEERDLEERFGDSYRAYRVRIRCWLPTFAGKR